MKNLEKFKFQNNGHFQKMRFWGKSALNIRNLRLFLNIFPQIEHGQDGSSEVPPWTAVFIICCIFLSIFGNRTSNHLLCLFLTWFLYDFLFFRTTLHKIHVMSESLFLTYFEDTVKCAWWMCLFKGCLFGNALPQFWNYYPWQLNLGL